ncbi:uncharacterized protein isoform X1 [Macaca fascicularis]|uniref:uncharacterized protein isoform X1 n=1 Tax=Macaca fascicularis TaxID=9541 RepID=UPI001E256BC8|nr:uncharacterized protein LOC123569763 isoform X1 [Macaca fascicularis]
MPVTVPRCRDWRSDGLRQPHPTQFPADLGKSPPSLQVRGPPAFPRGAGRRVLISDLRRVGEAARPPVLQPWGPHGTKKKAQPFTPLHPHLKTRSRPQRLGEMEPAPPKGEGGTGTSALRGLRSHRFALGARQGSSRGLRARRNQKRVQYPPSPPPPTVTLFL